MNSSSPTTASLPGSRTDPDARIRRLIFFARAALAGECELSRAAVERALVTLAARGLIFRAACAETIEIALLTGDLR